MKTPSAAYIAKEEASTRKPVEIYHIWRDGGTHWYYTSGDVSVTYDGNAYVPAEIARTQSKYNSVLDVTTMTFKVSALSALAQQYISINPVEVLWVSVMKLHREQAPLEADVVFVGQIKTVSFKGGGAGINCVGFEHFLKKTIPTDRYQLTCNHDVFDTKCALTKATYKVTETITLDATKTILTGTAFGTKADGYFTRGEVIFGDESRAIAAHVGTAITLVYAFVELVSTDSVDVYPGCDGRVETCRTKYANIVHFLGFPFIPIENPATRVTW